MLIAQAVVMIALLSCVWFALLGVVYAYRLASNKWAAPALHKQAFTGTWVGTLSAPPVFVPNLSPSPFLSERHRRDSIVEYQRQLAQAKAVRSAVLLHTSLDYFYLSSARAKGSVTFCGADGRQELLNAESGGTITDAFMGLELYSKDPQAGGGLKLQRSEDGVQASYNGAAVPVSGMLRPGTEADFRQLCAGLGGDPVTVEPSPAAKLLP